MFEREMEAAKSHKMLRRGSRKTTVLRSNGLFTVLFF